MGFAILPKREGLCMLALSQETRRLRDFLFLILFFMLLGIWATAWLAFHVAAASSIFF